MKEHSRVRMTARPLSSIFARNKVSNDPWRERSYLLTFFGAERLGLAWRAQINTLVLSGNTLSSHHNIKPPPPIPNTHTHTVHTFQPTHGIPQLSSGNSAVGRTPWCFHFARGFSEYVISVKPFLSLSISVCELKSYFFKGPILYPFF